MRWKTPLERNDKWREAAEIFEAELKRIEEMNRVKESHEKIGADMEKGLVEAEGGM